MAFYICSLRNEKSAGRIPQLITDDPAAVEAFAKKWDVPGRGVFECISYLKSGATRRCRETVDTLWRLPADIDFKDWVETPEEIDRTLQALPLPLSWARNSGGGRHVEYILKEPAQVGDEDYFERADRALKQLAARIGGDPAPTHPAALLRKPGTHNSKRGEPVRVAPLWGNGQAYDLTEVEALIELLPETGLFTPKTHGNGHDRAEGAPRPAGEYKAPIDVDRRLAEMRYEGPGDSSIHYTELHCTGSLLRCGCLVDDAVFAVLQAVRKAVANDHSAASWNWAQEEIDIRKMCTDLVSKNPELSATLPDKLREPFEAALAANRQPFIVYARHIGWHVRSKDSNNADASSNTGTGTKDSKKTEEPRAGDSPPHKYRFKLLRYCDLRPGMGDQDYLVDELLPTEGLVVVWGKFKCLKTFWVYDLMLHVAKGWEYRDRAVRQGMVVYCAFEGAHGFGKRTEAQRRHYGLADDDDAPLHVMPCQMNLVTDHKKFVADIGGQLEDGKKPAIVVLDTLNRSLVGSESKDADMSAYIAAASAIREEFKCLVIIVHHCGWDETRPRGHSSLSAAIEGQLAVTRQENHITVQIEFLRDGPEGAEIHSTTKVVEVGSDANGKPLTSLAVMPSNEASPGGGLWPKALIVFRRAMVAALANCGEDFQENILEPPIRAVATEEVRKEFYEIYPAKGNTLEQRHAAKQKQFRRCLERAQIDELVQIREPSNRPQLVWFTGRHATWKGE